MLKKIITMLERIDSRSMALAQKFNNFMEEWFDWWNRFLVARIFAVLTYFFLSTHAFLFELSEKDRSWGGFVFWVLLLISVLWLLFKYIRHRQKVSSEEDSSGLIKLYEIDEYGASNRRTLPVWIIALPVIHILIGDMRPESRNLDYLWAVQAGNFSWNLGYLCAYISLCLAGINNGKRKQRFKKFVKNLADKASEVLSPPAPSLNPQQVAFARD